MIVQTFTGQRGTVVRIKPAQAREPGRVYVRLWLHIGTPGKVPARVIVAYRPEDVFRVTSKTSNE